MDVRALVVHAVDQHLKRASNAPLQLAGADLLLRRHEAVPALLLDLFGHMARQVVGGGTGDILVLEAADPIELGRFKPVKEQREVGLGLARKAHDEGRAQGELGAGPARPGSGRASVPGVPGAASP